MEEGTSVAQDLSSTKNRWRLSTKRLALQEERKDPIPDRKHPRNTPSWVAQDGTPAEQKKVRAVVKKRFSSIGT